MDDKLKVWVIDDCFAKATTNGRRSLIDSLSENSAIRILKSDPNEFENFESKVESEFSNQIDLVIVDYKLDAQGQIFSNGSDLVSLIRRIALDTPIFLLSVDIRSEDEDKSIGDFERTISDNYLSNSENMVQDVDSLRAISNNFKSGNKDILMSLLKCPDFDQDNLLHALPASVRKSLKSKTENSEHQGSLVRDVQHKEDIPTVQFTRWFFDFFYRVPGFLLDSLSCAILLGVDLDYFESNIVPNIQEQLYDGPFSKTVEKRWWKTELESWLIDMDASGALGRTTNRFCEYATLLRVPKENWSKCVVCGESWPETIAVLSEDQGQEKYPVHIRCSEPDAEADRHHYFSQPRIVTE